MAGTRRRLLRGSAGLCDGWRMTQESPANIIAIGNRELRRLWLAAHDLADVPSGGLGQSWFCYRYSPPISCVLVQKNSG